MTTFNLGDVTDWQPVGAGELIEFVLPDNGYRMVLFDVMASGHASAYAVTKDAPYLVGTGTGFYSCRFSATEDIAVSFVADEGTEIFIRTRAQTQVLPEDPEASFVNIEPRRAGPSDEVTRMMKIMSLNMERREAMLREEMMLRFEAERAASREQAVTLTERVVEVPQDGAADA